MWVAVPVTETMITEQVKHNEGEMRLVCSWSVSGIDTFIKAVLDFRI